MVVASVVRPFLPSVLASPRRVSARPAESAQTSPASSSLLVAAQSAAASTSTAPRARCTSSANSPEYSSAKASRSLNSAPFQSFSPHRHAYTQTAKPAGVVRPLLQTGSDLFSECFQSAQFPASPRHPPSSRYTVLP